MEFSPPSFTSTLFCRNMGANLVSDIKGGT
jgi:hypothetical protein